MSIFMAYKGMFSYSVCPTLPQLSHLTFGCPPVKTPLSELYVREHKCVGIILLNIMISENDAGINLYF